MLTLALDAKPGALSARQSIIEPCFNLRAGSELIEHRLSIPVLLQPFRV